MAEVLDEPQVLADVAIASESIQKIISAFTRQLATTENRDTVGHSIYALARFESVILATRDKGRVLLANRDREKQKPLT